MGKVLLLCPLFRLCSQHKAERSPSWRRKFLYNFSSCLCELLTFLRAEYRAGKWQGRKARGCNPREPSEDAVEVKGQEE